MSILRICRECGFLITDDPRIAREQAVCCCIKPKGGLAVILHNSINSNQKVNKETEMGKLGESVISPELKKLDLDARKKQNKLLDLEIEARKVDIERQKVALKIEKKSI